MKIHLFTWTFLMPLIIVVLGVDVASVFGKCRNDQRSLLVQLNSSLAYNQSKSTKLVRWNLSTDCCHWAGVSCDEGGHGRVTGLDLSNESISGELGNSSSLFSLQFLQSLNLSFNNFTAALPTRFANLKTLMYLNLSNAGFVGLIPIEISQMTSLVSLDLSTLYFSGVSALKLENPNLARLVQNLTQLTELHLDGVNVSAKGKEWCDAVSNLSNLQVLSLSNCFLSGPIHSSLAKVHSLSVIRLDGNNLSTCVPEFFANFTKLTTLRLSSCGLHGTFPSKIFQVTTLEVLDLLNNRFLHGSFPEFLPNLALHTLALSGTSFSGTLPFSIGNLGKLTRMELAGCNFTGPIPNSLENLTQLVYLDLSFNRLHGRIPSLHMSKNLTHIDLSHNQLTGDISSIHWEYLTNLISLNLASNALKGNIPSSLFSIPSLQKILFSSNQFEGEVPDPSNAPSSSLDTLDLSGNKLEGSIPRSVFDLQRLNILSLSFNKFNDSIELVKIWKLSNLTSLDLSYSNLSINASGTSPNAFPLLSALKLASCQLKDFPDLRNQSKLINLDLSQNQIAGIVPQWFWEVGNRSLESLNLSGNLLVGLGKPLAFASLAILDLHDNQLRGNIPPPPPSATYVDYSSNNFSSSIPKDIGNSLSFAFFFSLSNNKLTGVMPASLCNAAYLKVLDLSHNNFEGKIPTCVIDGIVTLSVLNLRKNRFDGNIPDKFPPECKLQTLVLSGNRLEGKVPKSLVNCTMLEVLDLGNNQINDSFPCLLKKLHDLRVLVLRANRFHGDIICSQENGTWPRLQIIDLASNNFSGQVPSVCLATFKAMTGNGNETSDHLSFKTLELTPLYYQDSITVTSKGFEMEFVKILTVFTSIDFSLNHFEGQIPEAIGQFRALLGLNLSHNALSGPIPLSLGNLSQLESLDLSFNNLTGPIPDQLAGLTFLAFLNLSYNRLEGMIPSSTQFLTFSQASFEGNEGLCGPPLLLCKNPNSSPSAQKQNQKKALDWQFIVPGLAYGAGAGAVVALVMFCKKVNKWYDDRVDKILMALLPMLGFIYLSSNDWRNEVEENFEEDKGDDDIDDDEEEEEHGDDDFRGRYCVFCTRLDITRKRAIHDPKCTCYQSPTISSSSSFSSSSS